MRLFILLSTCVFAALTTPASAQWQIGYSELDRSVVSDPIWQLREVGKYQEARDLLRPRVERCLQFEPGAPGCLLGVRVLASLEHGLGNFAAARDLALEGEAVVLGSTDPSPIARAYAFLNVAVVSAEHDPALSENRLGALLELALPESAETTLLLLEARCRLGEIIVFENPIRAFALAEQVERGATDNLPESTRAGFLRKCAFSTMLEAHHQNGAIEIGSYIDRFIAAMEWDMDAIYSNRPGELHFLQNLALFLARHEQKTLALKVYQLQYKLATIRFAPGSAQYTRALHLLSEAKLFLQDDISDPEIYSLLSATYRSFREGIRASAASSDDARNVTKENARAIQLFVFAAFVLSSTAE